MRKVKLSPKFLTQDEKTHYLTLSYEQKKLFLKSYYKLKNNNNTRTPFIFKLITLNTTINNKNNLFNLYNNFLNLDNTTQEYFKYKLYFDTIIQIPFNNFSSIEISNLNEYLQNAKNTLETNIYGHHKTKQYIIQVLTQFITNPNSIGNIFGLVGPMGTGKTTFVKNISTILQRPLEIINLSGAQDVSFLEGHSFTYEGAKYGKILNTLIKHNTMDPIIFFDEVDKISKTEKGYELENLLINLIDVTQNYNFSDKYFQEITLDLSKITFIFSYNDSSFINKILKDRIYEIVIEGYSFDDKLILAQDFIIPQILSQFSFTSNDIVFSISSLKIIINNYCLHDEGVRQLKHMLYNIISKLHVLYVTQDHCLSDISMEIKFPIKLTKSNIKYVL